MTFELFVRPAIRRLAGHRDDDLFRPLDRAVLAGPVTKSSGRRAFVRVTVERDEHGTPRRDDRGRVRASLAGGRAARAATCSRRSPPPTPWPSSPRPTTASRPAPRSSCGGSTAPEALPGGGHARYPRVVMDPRPAGRSPPRAERRRLTHVDRGGRPRMVDVSAKPVDRPPRRRGGDGVDVGRDAQPRHRWRRPEGRRPRRRRAGRRHGRQADQRADPALPSAGADRPAGLDHARPRGRRCCGSGPRPRRPARPGSRWRP